MTVIEHEFYTLGKQFFADGIKFLKARNRQLQREENGTYIVDDN